MVTNATLAYWINAYNAYTIKLIAQLSKLSSIKNLNDPVKFISLAKTGIEGIEMKFA
jgi:hypothetical protein